MASDMYMKLQGIDGDSTDEKHPKWIELLSYSVGHSLLMDGTKSKGTRSSGKANFQDFTIAKQMDSTSPQIADHVARGHAPRDRLGAAHQPGGRPLVHGCGDAAARRRDLGTRRRACRYVKSRGPQSEKPSLV